MQKKAIIHCAQRKYCFTCLQLPTYHILSGWTVVRKFEKSHAHEAFMILHNSEFCQLKTFGYETLSIFFYRHFKEKGRYNGGGGMFFLYFRVNHDFNNGWNSDFIVCIVYHVNLKSIKPIDTKFRYVVEVY